MPFMLNYKRADRAPTVRVQEALRDAGFAPGPADGRFGLATMRAVVAYQTKHKLPTTGAVDEALYDSILSGEQPAAPKPKKAAAKKPAAKPAAKSSAATKPAAKKPAAKTTSAKG